MTQPAFLGLLLAAALLLGCGSGDYSSTDQPLTRSEFVKQANEICNAANEVLRAAMVEAFPADRKLDDATGIAFTHKTWIPNLRQQVRDLRQLNPPQADRRRIDSMLNQLTRLISRLEADPALASSGLFDRVTRRLTAYGIGPCGSP